MQCLKSWMVLCDPECDDEPQAMVAHNHSCSDVSWVYYADVPDDCSAIQFTPAAGWATSFSNQGFTSTGMTRQSPQSRHLIGGIAILGRFIRDRGICCCFRGICCIPSSRIAVTLAAHPSLVISRSRYAATCEI